MRRQEIQSVVHVALSPTTAGLVQESNDRAERWGRRGSTAHQTEIRKRATQTASCSARIYVRLASDHRYVILAVAGEQRDVRNGAHGRELGRMEPSLIRGNRIAFVATVPRKDRAIAWAAASVRQIKSLRIY